MPPLSFALHMFDPFFRVLSEISHDNFIFESFHLPAGPWQTAAAIPPFSYIAAIALLTSSLFGRSNMGPCPPTQKTTS